MAVWRRRNRYVTAFVAILLVATLCTQVRVAAANTVTTDAWAHATCTAAREAVATIDKSIRRGNRSLDAATDEPEQRDALSDIFTRVADAYDRLLTKMQVMGKPSGKNAQRIAATVQEGFVRARDVYKRSSFNVNLATGSLLLQVDDLVPPELVKVNSRELRSVLKRHPAPSLVAAFLNEQGCADLYFSQILVESTPAAPGHDVAQ